MSKDNIKKVTVEDMLKAGVHFGHQTRRKDPKMDKFVFDTLKRNQIIDLNQSVTRLERAAEFLYEVAKTGKQIIFVGTKRQAAPVVSKYAKEAGCLFVNQRWLGGTFTNFDSVAHNLKELERIETGLANNSFSHYTKKERLLLSRKVEKLKETVGGLRGLKKYPGAIVVIDINREKTAVAEANALKVPVVAMVDTNSNPDKVQFVIPSNDDAIKSIEIVLSVLASAIKEGYADQEVEKPVSKTESKASKPEPKTVKKDVKEVKEVKELKKVEKTEDKKIVKSEPKKAKADKVEKKTKTTKKSK